MQLFIREMYKMLNFINVLFIRLIGKTRIALPAHSSCYLLTQTALFFVTHKFIIIFEKFFIPYTM